MSDIDRQVKKAKKLLDKQLGKTIRGTTLALLSAIVKDTPVDTGRLRGNWDTTLNQESSFRNEAIKDPSGAVAISKSSTALSKYKPGDEIYLTNNLEYAVVIEDGDDKRRGHHMVERAKVSFNTQLEKNAAKFRIS